jgi:hypothetical protein
MDAIGSITRLFGPPSDFSLVIKFADSWRMLIKSLIQHPDDAQLAAAVQEVHLAVSLIIPHRHPSIILIFMDILALYEGFLETQIPQQPRAVRAVNAFRLAVLAERPDGTVSLVTNSSGHTY